QSAVHTWAYTAEPTVRAAFMLIPRQGRLEDDVARDERARAQPGEPIESSRIAAPTPTPTMAPTNWALAKREVLQRQLAMGANSGPQRPNQDPKPSDHDWPLA